MSFANATSRNSHSKLIAEGAFILLCVIILMIGAGLFATSQAIWTDETTQLSGLKLPLFEQLRWLTGNSDVGLGVPPDRMPPLSYWLGILWANFFGFSETSMRWFGIVAVSAAAPALYMTGKIAGGRLGGIFLLLFLFSSPVLMAQSVEIRAYPLFFTFSAWAVWCFSNLILSPEQNRPARQYILFGVFLLLAAYTHFFGIVAAACMLAALLVHRLWQRLPISPIVITSVTFIALSLGLAPFILSAVGVSAGGSEPVATLAFSDIGRGVFRLGFRVFLHPVGLSIPVVLAVSLLGIAGMIFLTFLLGLRSWTSRGENSSPERLSALVCVVLPLVFAFLGLPILKILISSFDVLAPHYNLWMVPLAGIILALSFNSKAGHMKKLSIGLGILVILGNLASAAQLLNKATLYSHGPGDWINEVIKKPSETLIIHNATAPWGNTYFSIYFLAGGKVTQWLQYQDGRVELISKSGLTPVTSPQGDRARFSMIIETESRVFNSQQLAKIASGKRACEFQSDWLEPGKMSGKIEYYCAFTSAARKISIK